jgi:anti-sigma B factor antagonist
VKGRVVRDEGGRGFRLEGEFDLANAPELAAAIAEHSDGGGVDVDMSEVTFMDTSGLHALVKGARSLEGGKPVVLVDPPSRVVRMMEIVGVTRMREIEIRSRQGG